MTESWGCWFHSFYYELWFEQTDEFNKKIKCQVRGEITGAFGGGIHLWTGCFDT